MQTGLQEACASLETHRHFARQKLRIYCACVVSKLTYSMSTMWLTEKQNEMLDAFHMKCLRSIAGIPSTWGAMVIGSKRICNEQVRSQMGVLYLSDEVKIQQLSLLGHVLRRPLNHPARVLCFDRLSTTSVRRPLSSWCKEA